MDMIENPLEELYRHCNAGDSKRKFSNRIEFPRMIDVELTNTCNFRCLMCPTGNLSQRRPAGFMEPSMFYRILEQAAPRKTPIRFIRWGEPLLHPDVLEFIQACTDVGIITHLNTNGSKLDEPMMRALIEVGLSSIKFSFQGVDRKSFEEMRNFDFYNDLVDRMRLFNQLRGDGTSPFLQLSTTITYETKEMIEDFKQEVSEFVDQLSIGRTVLDFINLDEVRLRSDEIEMLKSLKEMESVAKIHPECPEVYDKLSIDWNGLVTACCMDSDNLMVVGDAKTEPLEKIWVSEALEEYRRVLADLRHDDLPLCSNCYDYLSLSGEDLQSV